MELNRRSLLKLFALAPAAAIASKVEAAIEPLKLLALPDGVAPPAGARELANMREVRAYDVVRDEYVCRLDIKGKTASGEIKQLCVAYKAGHDDEDQGKNRDIALIVLTDAARADGIDLYSLMPLESAGFGVLWEKVH